MLVRIFHGDAIDFMRSLPDASVDHIITDPPYSAHTHANMRGNRGAAGIAKRDVGFAPMTATLRRAFTREAVRVARGWLVIFSDWESITWWRMSLNAAGGSYRRAIPWIRWSSPQFNKQAPPTGSEAIIIGQPSRPLVIAKPTSRQAFWLAGGRTHYDVKCLRANQKLGPDARKKEQAEKPVELMRQIIEDCSKPGDLVLDPFGGAGTTAEACVTTGRSCWLVERDENRYAVTSQRMQQVAETELEKCTHYETT